MKVNDSSNSKFVSGLIFILFGFIMLSTSVGLLINHFSKVESWKATTATITVIDHDEEEITFVYVYQDSSYKAISSIYSSTKKVGDSLVIYVNPNNPEEMYEHDLIIVSNAFIVVGSLFTILAIILFVLYNKFVKKKKICIEHGKKKTVNVGLIKKTSVYLNSRPYYMLFINYDNKEYKSHYFLMPRIFDMTTKKTVDLYIYDEKTYYIDVCSLKEKKEESDIFEY